MATAAKYWAVHIYYLTYFFKTTPKWDYYCFMNEETELHSCLWLLSKEVAKDKMQTLTPVFFTVPCYLPLGSLSAV